MPDTNEFVDISNMEVFKEGVHNGHTFKPKDIDEIVSNFNTLKAQLTPKVKISHGAKQESIAGLASYGDVVGVAAKTVDGIRKIFVDLTNVPEKVAQWIKERRFGERSVEIFPTIKINGKSFKNVLAKVALLGHQIPAVAGMSPVTVNLSIEQPLIDDDGVKFAGIEYDNEPEHFEYKLEAQDNIVKFNIIEREDKLDKEALKQIEEMSAKLKSLEGKLDTEEGRNLYKTFEEQLNTFKTRVETSEASTKTAEENASKLTKDNEDKDAQIKAFKQEKEDTNKKLKAEKTSNFVSELKKDGKITPAVEKDLTTLLCSLDDSEKTLEFTTKLEGGGDVKQKETQLEFTKHILSGLSKTVEFGEFLSGDGDNPTDENNETLDFVEINGTRYPVDGLNEEKAIQKYMIDFKVNELEASRVILDAKEKRENK